MRRTPRVSKPDQPGRTFNSEIQDGVGVVRHKPHTFARALIARVDAGAHQEAATFVPGSSETANKYRRAHDSSSRQ